MLRSDHLSRFQSAYCAGHSTETPLLRDLDSVYQQETTHGRLLVGLDVSAAFDTVSRKILLKRLNCVFDFSSNGFPHIMTTVINTFNSAAIDLHLYSVHPVFLRPRVVYYQPCFP